MYVMCAGRLPMSWTPKNFEAEVDFSDFEFARLGRSYRYAKQPMLARFGDGLSFSDHALTVVPPPSQCELIYTVSVNTTAGQLAGDVVVMAFLEPKRVTGLEAGTPLPSRQLVGVQRVHKSAADGRAKLLLVLDGEALKLTAIDGERAVRDGSYSVVFSSGVASDEVAVPLTLRNYVGECDV